MNQKLYVGGLVPLTSVDYPGRLAVVVFLQGCPWRCVYCHNKHLQAILPAESLPWEDILNLLMMRRGFIEAVVFSGGEPLFQSTLAEAMEEVKSMGYLIGLHTGGAYPDRFAKVLPMLDWVGFDVKQAFSKYRTITRIDGSGEKARESLSLLLGSDVDYEVRMTMDSSIAIDDVKEAMAEISQMGVRKVVLQKCRDYEKNEVDHPIFSDKVTLEDISKRFDDFFVRA